MHLLRRSQLTQKANEVPLNLVKPPQATKPPGISLHRAGDPIYGPHYSYRLELLLCLLAILPAGSALWLSIY